jgi:hypothetical protein
MQQPVTFILAFVFVLALIGLAAWLVRRFGGNRLGANSARGRMPRLAVIDAAAVDGRRRLVLVRRDNVEHLIMIGGPSDIVVEPNIVRAAPGRERDTAPQRETSRGPSFADTPTWTPPEPIELSEPDVAPEPAPPARPARPSFSEEPRRPVAAVLPERRPEPTIAAVTPEPPARPEPVPAPAPQREPALLRASRTETPRSEMPRSEPMMPRPMRADPPIRTMPPTRPLERTNITPAAPVVAKPEAPAVAPPAAPVSTTPSTPAAISAADQNLADMAQRLEAALRRPSGEPARSEAPEPRIGAPSVAPEAPAVAPRPRAPEVSIASAGRAEAPAITPPTKSGFENLEDEMASLLGRPKSSS